MEYSNKKQFTVNRLNWKTEIIAFVLSENSLLSYCVYVREIAVNTPKRSKSSVSNYRCRFAVEKGKFSENKKQ